jgi:hypothetical protein
MMSPVLTALNLLFAVARGWERSQLDHDWPARGRFHPENMGENVIDETRERLEARLQELRPQLEEAAKIEAALAALKNGPRPPVTALDMLKPVPNGGAEPAPDGESQT